MISWSFDHQNISCSVNQFISCSVNQFISSSVHQWSFYQLISWSFGRYISTSVAQLISSSVHQFISSSVHQLKKTWINLSSLILKKLLKVLLWIGHDILQKQSLTRILPWNCMNRVNRSIDRFINQSAWRRESRNN